MCAWSTRVSTPIEADVQPRRAHLSATSACNDQLLLSILDLPRGTGTDRSGPRGIHSGFLLFLCERGFNLLCAGLIRCCDSNRFVVGRYKDTSHVTLKCMSQKGTIEKDICETQLKVTVSGRHTCPICSVE